jgi:hypothetical protein
MLSEMAAKQRAKRATARPKLLGAPTTVRFSEDVDAWLRSRAKDHVGGAAGVIRDAVQDAMRRDKEQATQLRSSLLHTMEST